MTAPTNPTSRSDPERHPQPDDATAQDDGVRVGLIGTSWWADSMYLPALAHGASGSITAIAGRRRHVADEMAQRWNIPDVFNTGEEMIESGSVDAVIVASSNGSHYPLTMAALHHGLHVLCEKPLGLDSTEASEMAKVAAERGLITMTPFTYRWMPMVRQMQAEVADGYVGTPYHFHGRYLAGFARQGEYAWRFDLSESGSGVLDDIGTHLIDLASFTMGPIVAVSATNASMVPRDERPDGQPYERGEDVSMMLVRFASGAIGQLTVSAVCWQGGGFNQVHAFEVHGSEGSLFAESDWNSQQSLRGIRSDEEGPLRELPRDPRFWDGLRTDTVHNTYRDVFRTQATQARAWVDAIAAGHPVSPDFGDGAQAQLVVEAALRSARSGGEFVGVGSQ